MYEFVKRLLQLIIRVKYVITFIHKNILEYNKYVYLKFILVFSGKNCNIVLYLNLHLSYIMH